MTYKIDRSDPQRGLNHLVYNHHTYRKSFGKQMRFGKPIHSRSTFGTYRTCPVIIPIFNSIQCDSKHLPYSEQGSRQSIYLLMLLYNARCSSPSPLLYSVLYNEPKNQGAWPCHPKALSTQSLHSPTSSSSRSYS